MKKYIYILVSNLLIMVGCNKEPEYFELVSPEDQMKISANENNIALQLAGSKKEAVRFTWNDSSPKREGGSISYGFRIFETENKSHITDLIDLGSEARSFSYTHHQLNEILKNWDILPGDEVNLTAQVIATVNGAKVYIKPEISLTQFNATGYNNTLYLFYKTKDEVILRSIMTKDANNESVYTWSGTLPIAHFWFSTNEDTGYPAYTRGEDSGVLTYQPTEGGTPFEVSRSDVYDIIIDFETMKLDIK